MSIGANIKALREDRNLTQEQVAEALAVSFQAVSAWARDAYKPETDKLIKLAELFEVSVSAIAEERTKAFRTKEAIYNWEHMKTFVKTSARNFKLRNTLKAVDYAVEAHEGQHRKKSVVPYIYHPLNLACHLLSMGIREDEIIAAALLHDVVEDCGKQAEELPVNDETKELVVLLTHGKTTDSDRDAVMKAYYDEIVFYRTSRPARIHHRGFRLRAPQRACRACRAILVAFGIPPIHRPPRRHGGLPHGGRLPWSH